MLSRRTPVQRPTGGVLGALLGVVLGVVLLAGCGDQDGAAEDAAATGEASSESPTSSPSATTGEPSTGASSPSSSPSSSAAPDLPACDEVWVDGATLPRTYRGCFDGEEPRLPERLPCSFGGAIVTFDNRYYAVAGKVINDEKNLDTSRTFDNAAAACLA